MLQHSALSAIAAADAARRARAALVAEATTLLGFLSEQGLEACLLVAVESLQAQGLLSEDGHWVLEPPAAAEVRPVGPLDLSSGSGGSLLLLSGPASAAAEVLTGAEAVDSFALAASGLLASAEGGGGGGGSCSLGALSSTPHLVELEQPAASGQLPAPRLQSSRQITWADEPEGAARRGRHGRRSREAPARRAGSSGLASGFLGRAPAGGSSSAAAAAAPAGPASASAAAGLGSSSEQHGEEFVTELLTVLGAGAANRGGTTAATQNGGAGALLAGQEAQGQGWWDSPDASPSAAAAQAPRAGATSLAARAAATRAGQAVQPPGAAAAPPAAAAAPAAAVPAMSAAPSAGASSQCESLVPMLFDPAAQQAALLAGSPTAAAQPWWQPSAGAAPGSATPPRQEPEVSESDFFTARGYFTPAAQVSHHPRQPPATPRRQSLGRQARAEPPASAAGLAVLGLASPAPAGQSAAAAAGRPRVRVVAGWVGESEAAAARAFAAVGKMAQEPGELSTAAGAALPVKGCCEVAASPVPAALASRSGGSSRQQQGCKGAPALEPHQQESAAQSRAADGWPSPKPDIVRDGEEEDATHDSCSSCHTYLAARAHSPSAGPQQQQQQQQQQPSPPVSMPLRGSSCSSSFSYTFEVSAPASAAAPLEAALAAHAQPGTVGWWLRAGSSPGGRQQATGSTVPSSPAASSVAGRGAAPSEPRAGGRWWLWRSAALAAERPGRAFQGGGGSAASSAGVPGAWRGSGSSGLVEGLRRRSSGGSGGGSSGGGADEQEVDEAGELLAAGELVAQAGPLLHSRAPSALLALLLACGAVLALLAAEWAQWAPQGQCRGRH
jgi:hypothetical protein